MQISRDDAYDAYMQFSHARREYKPRSKEWWSRDLRRILRDCVSDGRPRADNPDRKRLLTFGSLGECRSVYGEYVHAPDIEWQPADEPQTDIAGNNGGISPTLQAGSLHIGALTPPSSEMPQRTGDLAALATAAVTGAADLAVVRRQS